MISIGALLLASVATENYCPTLVKVTQDKATTESICHAGIEFNVNKKSKLPEYAVYISKPKLKKTPVQATDWSATYNYFGDERAKGLFKSTVGKGLDYGHLVDPYTYATETEQVVLLQADINRLPMIKEFNRTGLYKQLERYEQEQKLMKGYLYTLAGHFDLSGVSYFYRTFIQFTSDSHISFIIPEKPLPDTTLNDYVTSIQCIEKAANITITTPEHWDIEKSALPYSLDIWAMGFENRNQKTECNWSVK